MSGMIPLIAGAVGAFVLLYVVLDGIYAVNAAEIAVITRLGKFNRIARSGMHWKLPLEKVACRLSLRAQNASHTAVTETRDCVQVALPVSVEVRLDPGLLKNGYKGPLDLSQVVRSCVDRTVADMVPRISLDTLFATQSSVAAAIESDLNEQLGRFGYEVISIKASDLIPVELEASFEYRGMLLDA
jgi:regulator of protease activity HflC (stomatin/prohibitin superfamily)